VHIFKLNESTVETSSLANFTFLGVILPFVFSGASVSDSISTISLFIYSFLINLQSLLPNTENGILRLQTKLLDLHWVQVMLLQKIQ
jgi:hypothetical protein